MVPTIAGALALALLANPLAAPPTILPASLGPLKIASWLEGGEARASIDRLHGRPIPMVAGYVAQYRATVGGLPSEATLWASKAEDEKEAEGLIGRMVEGLQRGGTGFGHDRTWKEGEQVVHGVYGNGQKHIVFRSGPWIVWLAYDPHLPADVAREALAFGRPPPD